MRDLGRLLGTMRPYLGQFLLASLLLDPEAITPRRTLSQIRGA